MGAAGQAWAARYARERVAEIQSKWMTFCTPETIVHLLEGVNLSIWDKTGEYFSGKFA